MTVCDGDDYVVVMTVGGGGDCGWVMTVCGGDCSRVMTIGGYDYVVVMIR